MTAILFPVISKKELSLFIRINTYGTIFVMMVLLFIISFGIIGLTTTTYVFTQDEVVSKETRYIPLFSKNFASLAGILSLGFYLHNISIPIINNNQNPK